MAKQPFSAPKPRSLPTVAPNQNLNETLANWQTQLAPLVQNVAPQATPQNFSVTNSRGGMTISWSPVSGADGYEILKSASGSFTDDLQVIPVKNANQSSYFDSTGGNSQTAHYRIRSTSGTASNPQSQRGPESGVVKQTSIDASDTKSVPVTVRDNFTTDATRANARLGNYGAIKPSTLGKVGGSLAGSGATGGAGTSTGTPASGATNFGSIGTGANTTAAMTVGSGARIVPDGASPGIIAATQLWNVPVTQNSPSDTNGLQYNATNGDLEYVPTAQTFTATTSQWLNAYSAVTGLFTATQPAASDLSNGTIGSGKVVLSTSPTLYGNPIASNFTLVAPAAIAATAQVSFGALTAATASTGGGQATPATVLGYLVANVGGTTVKIPYYPV